MKTILTTHLIFCILLLPGLVQAQAISISGKVTNSNGKALENVSVFESNKKIGTITNEKGFFKLTLSEGELNLKISETGFMDYLKEFVLTRDTTFEVRLAPLVQDRNDNKKPTDLSAAAKTTKKHNENSGFK